MGSPIWAIEPMPDYSSPDPPIAHIGDPTDDGGQSALVPEKPGKSTIKWGVHPMIFGPNTLDNPISVAYNGIVEKH